MGSNTGVTGGPQEGHMGMGSRWVMWGSLGFTRRLHEGHVRFTKDLHGGHMVVTWG
jgi:hypothetical protein